MLIYIGYNPRRHSTVYTDDFTNQRKEFVVPEGITIPRIANGYLWEIRVRSRVGNLAEALDIQPDRHLYGSRKGAPLDKYLSMSGSKPSTIPFNADALRRWSRDVLIVEGEFDAALAQQILGDQAVVITMGSATSTIPQEWIDKLKRAPHIYSCMDADGAGQAAAQRLAAALGDKHKLLTLPYGKDITEYVVDHAGNLAAWWTERERVRRGWWIGGVPDSIRSAILSYLPPSAATILKRLNEALNAGLLDPDHITIPIYKRLNTEKGWGFSTATIDRAFDQLTDVFLSKLPPLKSLSIEEKILNQGRRNSDKNPKTKKVGGRPSAIFAAMSLVEAKIALATHARPRIYEKVHPIEGRNRVLAQIKLEDGESSLNSILNATFGYQRRATYRRARTAYDRLVTDFNKTASTPITGSYTNASSYRRQVHSRSNR